MKSREKKHARGEGPGASAHTWPHPLLPHSPTASECPGPLPASSFLPPPWDGRCPPRPEGGAWWWLSLPSAGSTTACPSDPSTKCVPVLRVHPVGLVMAHGKGREASRLGLEHHIFTWLGPYRGATTLKAALHCPQQEASLARRLCHSAGQEPGVKTRELIPRNSQPLLGATIHRSPCTEGRLPEDVPIALNLPGRAGPRRAEKGAL